MSRDKDEKHGLSYTWGLVQRKYNGTYTQGFGQYLTDSVKLLWDII